MKQFIIMSLSLSILVLSGCKDAEKECKEKGDGWIWDATKKECIVTPKTEEDCKAKGDGWIWDATKEECKAPPSATELSNKEKCEAKGDGWYWDEDDRRDEDKEYEKCKREVSVDCKDPAKPIARTPYSTLECVAPYIVIVSSRYRLLISLSEMSRGHYDDDVLIRGSSGCYVMDKHTSDGYVPFEIKVHVSDGTEQLGMRGVTICEPGGSGSPPSCPTSEGVYEVQVGRSGLFLSTVTKTVEELRELGCFRRIIRADGPL